MSWQFYNPNPYGNLTGDCVIRALTLALSKNWDDVYTDLAEFGFKYKLMPSSNENWPHLLRKSGFTRHIIPNECPDCYTVRDFCEDYPKVSNSVAIDVPRCCCITASVEYVSGVTDGTTTPTPSINVIDGSVSIKKRQ